MMKRLAWHFIYSQVYFPAVRRIYDIHLKDFLKEWLPDGQFPITVDDHLRFTDNEVLAGMLKAASEDTRGKMHGLAERIVSRKHFKLLFKRNPSDSGKTRRQAQKFFRPFPKNSAVKTFGTTDIARGVIFLAFQSNFAAARSCRR